MKALVYGVAPEPFRVPDDANLLTRNLANSPVGLRDVPDPVPLHDDWVVTRPRLTGICGSDSKQILLDFGEGDTDNAMAAFCSSLMPGAAATICADRRTAVPPTISN